MAKAAHLTPEVKSLIAQTHLEHPDYGPTKVREKLLKRMKETGLDRNFGSGWPNVSAVGKVLTDIRKEESELGPDPEDRPWSVAALAYYDIPPEVLPGVMKVWAKALVDDTTLTIRQVKWIARLSCILSNKEDLIVKALGYAAREKAIQLTGAYPDKPENMRWLWFGDAVTYLDMTGDDSLLRTIIKSMKWLPPMSIAELQAELDEIKGDTLRKRAHLKDELPGDKLRERSLQPAKVRRKKGGTS